MFVQLVVTRSRIAVRGEPIPSPLRTNIRIVSSKIIVEHVEDDHGSISAIKREKLLRNRK